VGEAQEVERLRFRETAFLPVLRRKAAELDKTGLVRLQLQAELRKPLPKIPKSLLENLRAAGERIWMFPGVAACR